MFVPMKQILTFCLLAATLLLSGCGWHPSFRLPGMGHDISIDRYDRIEALYLTTGDFSALQKMNIDYPIQTRTLIEDVLKIGHVNDSEINMKFLHFFQDTTLQAIINEVGQQYADMDDVSDELDMAFMNLKELMPELQIPKVYTQIGALDQSIIITNDALGICLDKYLGEDYATYQRYYPLDQRRQMTRGMIVPDCLHFFLLSYFPLPNHGMVTQEECDFHMAKIQWLVNRLLKRKAFNGRYLNRVDAYMKQHPHWTGLELLLSDADSVRAIVR